MMHTREVPTIAAILASDINGVTLLAPARDGRSGVLAASDADRDLASRADGFGRGARHHHSGKLAR